MLALQILGIALLVKDRMPQVHLTHLMMANDLSGEVVGSFRLWCD